MNKNETIVKVEKHIVKGKEKHYVIIENYAYIEYLTVTAKQYERISKMAVNAKNNSNTLA